MDEPFLGMIAAFGFDFPPRGWALCIGQYLQVNDNQALYSLLSDFYGGIGDIEFALPDLQGRAAVGFDMGNAGKGLDTYGLGQMVGYETIWMQNEYLPAHSHDATFTASGGGNPSAATASLFATTSPGQSAAPLAGAMLGQSVAGPNGPVNRIYQDFNGDQTAPRKLDAVYCYSGGIEDVDEIIIESTGNKEARINTLSPFLAINYCIAIEGLYPPRS